MWHVYLIKSLQEEWYYVGSTNDLVRRIRSHKLGQVKSTKAHRPLIICKTWQFANEHAARIFEKQIKQNRSFKSRILERLRTTE